jgi:microcystin-dependent protein
MNWETVVLVSITLILFSIMLFYMQYIRRERIEMQKEAVVGDLKHSSRTSDFSGWMICDGRSVERSKYHELFEVIGTKYGSSSNTTFNLPDCRGRLLGAIGRGSNLTNRVVGTSIGEETHTMLLSELVSHHHTGITDMSGNHIHTGTTDTAGDHTHTGTTNSDGDHTHTHNAGGGQNNLGLAVANGSNTVIDTDASQGELNVWTVPRTLTLNNNGSHSHTVSTVNNGDHTHTFTSESNGNHTHTFTSNNTGEGQAFNIMQPTLFVGHVFIYYGHHH